jgi:hypothetical protein
MLMDHIPLSPVVAQLSYPSWARADILLTLPNPLASDRFRWL